MPFHGSLDGIRIWSCRKELLFVLQDEPAVEYDLEHVFFCPGVSSYTYSIVLVVVVTDFSISAVHRF